MNKQKNKNKQDKHHRQAKFAEKDSNHNRVLSVIKALGHDALLKNIFPELLKKLTQEEIILALNKLDRDGIIRIHPRGIIEVLKKETPASPAGGQDARHKVQDEGANKSAVRNPKSGFLFGTVDISRTGTGYVEVEGFDKDIFVPAKSLGNAMQGDEVKLRLTSHGRRPEGEIIAVIKRAQESFPGRIEVLEKFAFFKADERRLNTDVFVPLTALNGAKSTDRVIVRIMDWNTGSRNPRGEVVEVMQDKQSSDLDMKMILISNGFSIDFPHAVYKELDKYSENFSPREVANRLDMRDVLTFTIDPEDARDFDDAISFRVLPNGNYEIGVHIADVSHYVPEGSELDKEAEKRATSVYLPDRVCPMLPEKLSNVLCSLRPNEDKLTFSAIFEMGKEFDIKHFTIAKTIIHSNRRFSYEQAQEVLETGQGDHAEELKILHRIANHIRAQRMKKGAIAFEKAEVKFKLDETGKPLGVVLKIRKDAHLLIEDFMLLANETVAKFGSKLHKGKKAQPFVYRVHDKPDPAKLEMFSAVASRFGYKIDFADPRNAAPIFNTLLKKIEGKPEQDVLETMAIRSMAKAEYTTKNIGHYGLAMEYYTHFTSPIRRYPDVLVHRLLSNILNDGGIIIDRDELEGRCKNSSLMERKAMDAEREAIKYKQIEFLQDKVGEEFEGIITGVIPRGVFVELVDNKCEGMVSTELLGDEEFIYEEKMVRLTGTKTRRRFELGGKVKVKVLSADIILRRIDLGLAGGSETPKKKPQRGRSRYY